MMKPVIPFGREVVQWAAPEHAHIAIHSGNMLTAMEEDPPRVLLLAGRSTALTGSSSSLISFDPRISVVAYRSAIPQQSNT